jgi:hypothetical protein
MDSFPRTDDYYRAYGEFEATRNCSDFTSASFLKEVGKKTPVLLRVSTVGPEAGSADISRDVHGWAMKLYTDEGNLDWVFNNTVRQWSPHYQAHMKYASNFLTTTAYILYS